MWESEELLENLREITQKQLIPYRRTLCLQRQSCDRTDVVTRRVEPQCSFRRRGESLLPAAFATMPVSQSAP